MLGRSKPEMKRLACSRRSRWAISSRVRSSAVAVSAMRGTPGNSSASCPSCRYSGRKSCPHWDTQWASSMANRARSEEHTSELQSRPHLVCRLLLEKKKKKKNRQSQEKKKNKENRKNKKKKNNKKTNT